jgi:hypothetical protein
MEVFVETEQGAQSEQKGAWKHGNLDDEGDEDE